MTKPMTKPPTKPTTKPPSTVHSTRRRAARTPPAARRAQLLDAATLLVRDGGSEALRMDALARVAGVTRPVVYEHFNDREDVLLALLKQHAAHVQARVDEALDGAKNFEEILRRSVPPYLASVKAQGGAIRGLISASGMSPRIEIERRAIWDGAAKRWAVRFRAEFEIAQSDAEALAAYHLQGLWALAGRWLEGQISARRLEDLHVIAVLSSVRAVSTAHRSPRTH